MPTFFVIGAAKCGTTSLHEYLDQHPDISMSRIKEPSYFRPDADSYTHMVSDRREYLDLFSPGTQHRGESSTPYSSCLRHPGVPAAISAATVEPKFIYMVRDPVERVSAAAHEMLCSQSKADRDHASATLSAPGGLARLVGDLTDPQNTITGAGLYMTQIRAYLEVFERESILVIDSVDLL